MRTTRGLAALVTAALLTVVPTAQAAGPRAAATEPAVGDCHALTPAQADAASDTSAAIPCSQRHDDRVIAVRTLPAGVSWSDLDTHRSVVRTGVRLCTPPLRRVLGQDQQVRDRTAYSFLYFAPTPRQQAKGARWLRCDLVLVHGQGLAPLPTDREPALLHSTPADPVARCLNAALATTTCTAHHLYRATGTFVVARSSYPGRPALLRLGRSTCPRLVSTDTDFRFTMSTRLVWDVAHDHVVVCYSRTTG